LEVSLTMIAIMDGGMRRACEGQGPRLGTLVPVFVYTHIRQLSGISLCFSHERETKRTKCGTSSTKRNVIVIINSCSLFVASTVEKIKN